MTPPTVNTKNSSSGFSFPDQLYKNIDVAFFESIICGPLRPFLSPYDSPKELQKLATITVKGEFEMEEIKKWNQKRTIPKEILEKYNVRESDHISFKFSDNKALYITFSKPEDQIDPVFDFDFPDPPDEKAKYFLQHIKIEFDLMKNKAYKVLNQSASVDQLTLYANKNIQRLKDFAFRAEKLNKKLNPDNISYLYDANLYVLYIVKEFLVYSIMFYQEFFQPFLNYESEEYNALKRLLYGKKYPGLLVEPTENSENEIIQKEGTPNSNQKNMDRFFSIQDLKENIDIPEAFTLKGYNSKFAKLNYVLESLKSNHFICEYTNIKDFRKIFNNETPLNKIKWITPISDLAHFIRLLHNTYKVIENIDKVKWKVADQVFIKEDGLPFGWENFSGKKIPAKARLIENAVEFLK